MMIVIIKDNMENFRKVICLLKEKKCITNI